MDALAARSACELVDCAHRILVDGAGVGQACVYAAISPREGPVAGALAVADAVAVGPAGCVRAFNPRTAAGLHTYREEAINRRHY
jgi:hypothetical protein